MYSVVKVDDKGIVTARSTSKVRPSDPSWKVVSESSLFEVGQKFAQSGGEIAAVREDGAAALLRTVRSVKAELERKQEELAELRRRFGEAHAKLDELQAELPKARAEHDRLGFGIRTHQERVQQLTEQLRRGNLSLDSYVETEVKKQAEAAAKEAYGDTVKAAREELELTLEAASEGISLSSGSTVLESDGSKGGGGTPNAKASDLAKQKPPKKG